MRAVCGGSFALRLTAPPETKSQPLVHAGLQIQLAVVFWVWWQNYPSCQCLWCSETFVWAFKWHRAKLAT